MWIGGNLYDCIIIGPMNVCYIEKIVFLSLGFSLELRSLTTAVDSLDWNLTCAYYVSFVNTSCVNVVTPFD